MGFWAYYSPLWLGFLVTLVLHDTVWANAPGDMPESAHWPFIVGAGLVCGLLCQFVMIGVQGAFAQVLPVPVGRSIRGRGAVIGGLLIIACGALAAVAGLLHSDGMTRAASIVGLLSLASAVGIAGTYFWCWPMAERDFDGKI